MIPMQPELQIDDDTYHHIGVTQDRAVRIARRPMGAEILFSLCFLMQYEGAFEELAPVLLRVIQEKTHRADAIAYPPRRRGRRRKAQVITFSRIGGEG